MSESTAREVWRAVLGDLQLQLPRPTFETWLKPTEGVAYDDHVFEVEAPNSFAVEWLERRMYHALQKTLHKVSGREFELQLTVKSQGDFYAVEQSFPVPDQAVSATPAAPPLFEIRSFNPKYSFDTFVAGPSNRLALSASRAVAESSGQTYNPLFLHSGAGLGKTHLLQAIGKSCASRGMSVLYVTSEQFTNEFITAIRNRTTEDFRRRYRSVQVLLMDDVQFLSGKEQTHEGFFHTFNDLHNSGNQVVISSDRPPKELGSIEDRLRSRFEGGLIAGIQPPDLETRMAILFNKAGQLRVEMEESVVELIAKRVQRNVRELEGSLNRMVAYSQLMNVNPGIDPADSERDGSGDRRPVHRPAAYLRAGGHLLCPVGGRPDSQEPHQEDRPGPAGCHVFADPRARDFSHPGGPVAGRARPLHRDTWSWEDQR